ncbi:MAG TPA: hypothetical protein VNT75_04900 [Symbiobacteriaceae bacterium]|nr:hypothetical protein [Symbiobacteriaceae bacterium]
MRELGSGYELQAETEGGRQVLRARAYHAPAQMRVTLTFPAGGPDDLAAFKDRLLRAPAGRGGP